MKRMKRFNNPNKFNKTKKSSIMNQKGKRVKRIRPRFFVVLLILVIILFATFANIFNNKTEASTADVYDVILFWGQSNMVGCSSASEETRHLASYSLFSEKTGIDIDIVENIRNRADVKVAVPNGIAYEYLYYPNSEVGWTGSSSTRLRDGVTYTWTEPHLKPIGYNNVNGEFLKGNTNGTITSISVSQVSQSNCDHDTAFNGPVNMVPEFCKKYYELTGRKVIAVECFKGGQSIDFFAPGTTMNIVMKKKFEAAVNLVKSRSDMQLGKCMFVSMQGESNCGNMTTAQYVSVYKSVIDSLKEYNGITNGALVETGHEIPNGGRNNYNFSTDMAIINTIHEAQVALITGYADIVLGSDFAYNGFIPRSQSDYEQNCFTKASYVPGSDTSNPNNRLPYDKAIQQASLRFDYDHYEKVNGQQVLNDRNVIHLTSASLCQIGRETATNLASTLEDGRIHLNSSAISTQVTDIASVNVTYNKSGGTIRVSSENPSIASIDESVLANSSDVNLINTNTLVAINSENVIKIKGNSVGKTRICVTSDAIGEYKKAYAYFDVTVTKKALVIPVVTDNSKTYNGEVQSPDYTGYDDSTMNISGNTETNAGEYTITFGLKNPTNYEWNDETVTDKPFSWNIAKAKPTITLSSTSGSVNVGNTKSFTASVTPGAGDLNNPSSSNTNIATATKNGNTITVNGISEGRATITISCNESTNYLSESVNYTIDVANRTMSVTADDWVGDYDGENHRIALGVPSGTTVTYSSDGINYSETHPVCKNAGKYTIYYKIEKRGFETETGARQVIIIPKASTNVIFSDKTWGTSGFKVKVNGSSYGFILEYSTNKNNWTNIANGGFTSEYEAGKTIYVRFIDATNSNNVNSQENYASFELTKDIGSLTLGATSGILTYPEEETTTIRGTGALSVISSSNPNVATASISGDVLTITPGTASGTAIITVRSGETDRYTMVDKTYTATVNNGTMIVTADDWIGEYDGLDHTITLEAPQDAIVTYGTDGINYNETKPIRTNAGITTVFFKVEKNGYTTINDSRTIKITPKKVSSLNITLDQSSYEYDGTEIKPTVSVKDGRKTLTNEIDYTVSYSFNTDVGTATATITGKGNYEGTKILLFTITVRSEELPVNANGYDETYDGLEHGIDVTCDGATIEYSENGTDYSEVNPKYKDAGEYRVYYKVSKNGYADVTGDKIVRITKRNLIVTAESKSKTEGQDNPELTVLYEGNVDGEIPNFTGNLETTATKNSEEGTYDITQGTLNLSDGLAFKTKNYTMSFVKGTMTITNNTQNTMSGDVNNNNKIDISDILLIQRHIAQQNSATIANKYPNWKLSDEKINLADTNKNGRVDIADILLIQRYIAAKNSSTVANSHPNWLEL